MHFVLHRGFSLVGLKQAKHSEHVCGDTDSIPIYLSTKANRFAISLPVHPDLMPAAPIVPPARTRARGAVSQSKRMVRRRLRRQWQVPESCSRMTATCRVRATEVVRLKCS